MTRYENDCVDCAAGAYPCNPLCKRKRVAHHYCDACGCEDNLYWFNGSEICFYCLEEETGDAYTYIKSKADNEREAQ